MAADSISDQHYKSRVRFNKKNNITSVRERQRKRKSERKDIYNDGEIKKSEGMYVYSNLCWGSNEGEQDGEQNEAIDETNHNQC